MKKQAKLGCLLGILSLLITQPIWFYLLYKILQSVEATDLMWFLYWVYVPASLFIGIFVRLLESIVEE